jgi:hypothetical protein
MNSERLKLKLLYNNFLRPNLTMSFMRLLNFFFILSILTLSVSCEKKDPAKNSEAKLLGITLTSGNGVIDTANKKVILRVPETVDLTKIVAHFEISANATLYPPSDVVTNYSEPVIYTITSEDKTKQYIFTVSAFKPSEAKLLEISLASGIGIIDTANKKITLKVPENVDLTKIVPHFTISSNATLYPPSDVATNYSEPVVYTITSEDKTKQYIFTVSAFKPIARFIVYDCSSWTPTVTKTLQPGAVIKIYSTEEDVNTSKTYDILTTDQTGKAEFYGVKGTGYLVTVSKDNKSNIMNGYILDGRYDDQAEVDSYPIYANAVIGGFKFKDINGDGRVWPDDKYNYDWIGVSTYFTGVQSIDLYIAGAK